MSGPIVEQPLLYWGCRRTSCRIAELISRCSYDTHRKYRSVHGDNIESKSTWTKADLLWLTRLYVQCQDGATFRALIACSIALGEEL